ncbi:DUF6488 family protein [Hahella ganghwensis]|uniref:DUF6488 family protein n=1 Tax=Hahella ganghwensis TaxID=286420 RepID=UPI000373B30A|nr:DUF6488 family protein [Hahella ganghwensis]
MMIARFIIATLFALTLASPVSAHSDHGAAAPITEAQASEQADAVKQYLVDNQQVEASWNEAGNGAVSLKEVEAGKLWVVQYNNPAASDPAARSLYVIIDELGNVLAANHTGEI